MLTFFYVFAAAAVLGGLGLLVFRSPVYCALSLVFSLLAVSGIFILLNNEFVAAINVLIYAGAIMVLFLFVIMLLNLRTPSRDFRHEVTVPRVLGIGVSVAILAQMVSAFTSPTATLGPLGRYTAEYVRAEGPVEIIGELMFTTYVLPFEIIAVLLMVGVVGAVIIAKRRLPADENAEEGA